MRRIALPALLFVVGLAVGGVVARPPDRRESVPSDYRSGGADVTIEVYRHPASERPALAETLRVLSVTARGETVERGEPRGEGRNVWTVRVNRVGSGVVAYTAESVSR